jgi:hypothetical protein
MVTADVTLHQAKPTQNDGANERLMLGAVPGRGSEDRIVLSFDGDALHSILADARIGDVYLLLTPEPDENSAATRNMNRTCEMSLTADPLSDDFAEGNGNLSAGDSGEGVGATWLCAADRDIQDNRNQCLVKWSHPFVNRTGGTNATQLESSPAPLAWNVTADIKRGIHRWVIKRQNNSHGCIGTSELRYYSREGAAEIADMGKAPRLLLIRTD